MIDDDVTYFKRLYVEEGETKILKDKSEITSKYIPLYELAKMTNINLFGICKSNTPRHFDITAP